MQFLKADVTVVAIGRLRIDLTVIESAFTQERSKKKKREKENLITMLCSMLWVSERHLTSRVRAI